MVLRCDLDVAAQKRLTGQGWHGPAQFGFRTQKCVYTIGLQAKPLIVRDFLPEVVGQSRRRDRVVAYAQMAVRVEAARTAIEGQTRGAGPGVHDQPTSTTSNVFACVDTVRKGVNSLTDYAPS